MKKKTKIGRVVGVVIYTMVLSFWIASGLKTNSIIASKGYVLEAYRKTIDLDDNRTIFYRESGTIGQPVMLFIHGFLGSSYDFLSVFEHFQENYHVIALDLIGFGLSGKPTQYDYGKVNQARTVLDFIEVKNLTSITLMAHSMGGEVSLHLAAMAPEKIQQLILVGSAGFYEEGASTNPPSLPLFVYREIVQNYFIQRTFFFTAYSEYERQNGLVTTKDFDEMYLVNRTIPAQILRQFGEDNDSGPMQHIIDQVEHPTLLIWGEMDGFIPYATGEKLAESLGENAQLVKMNLAGHLPFDTFFDSFIQHVEEFIT
jgi:pimeloyl-ACP methyl ester carboxylesterase